MVNLFRSLCWSILLTNIFSNSNIKNSAIAIQKETSKKSFLGTIRIHLQIHHLLVSRTDHLVHHWNRHLVDLRFMVDFQLGWSLNASAVFGEWVIVLVFDKTIIMKLLVISVIFGFTWVSYHWHTFNLVDSWHLRWSVLSWAASSSLHWVFFVLDWFDYFAFDRLRTRFSVRSDFWRPSSFSPGNLLYWR